MYLVHLLPAGAGLLLDELEEGGHGEEGVLDHVKVLNKVQHLGLAVQTHDIGQRIRH